MGINVNILRGNKPTIDHPDNISGWSVDIYFDFEENGNISLGLTNTLAYWGTGLWWKLACGGTELVIVSWRNSARGEIILCESKVGGGHSKPSFSQTLFWQVIKSKKLLVLSNATI